MQVERWRINSGHVWRETQRRHVDDVEAVVAILLQDHKVAAATHNIMAYRIAQPNGVWAQDHDDDGETAAGKNLLHLMQLVDVVDVVVVRSPRTAAWAGSQVTAYPTLLELLGT